MEVIDTRIILPIISILAIGSLEVDLIKKWILKIKTSDSTLEHLLESLVLGSISLVIPMLAVGILADRIDSSKILERFVYIYFAIGLSYLVFKVYMWIRRKLPALVLRERKKITKSVETLFLITALLMLFFYTLQGLVYPLRGWDFLHFYLPNSFRVYLTGQMGEINELNFYPQFKPPLNVLLYAYVFFVTQSEMLHLVPMMFLAGTVYLCYKIARIEGITKRNSLVASVAFLATPFVFFLVYEFQYYQETYVMFFTTAAFYFFRKFFKEKKTKNKFYFALLVSLALSGCILSKVSGFIIPIVLFVAMPSDKIGKVLRILLIAGFSFQLIRKSIFEIYLGTGILISLLAVYCVYLVIKSETLSFSYKRWGFIFGIYFLPLAIGILWGLYILTIPGVKDILFDLYVNLQYNQVSLIWPGITLPGTETYLENAHTATFVSSSFSILIATMFAGTWALFKIAGFIKSNGKHNELLLWLVFFFVFWQGFFAKGSIRYMSPIIVPLTIVFIVGLISVVDFFNKRDGKDRDGFLAIIFIIASSYLSLYPIMPFEIINENFHLRWYLAHYNIGSLIGYISLFTLFTVFLIWKEKDLKLSFPMVYTKKFNPRKILAAFLLFILFFVPFGAQAALLIYVNFDINTFQSEYCYYTRADYMELVDAINRLGFSDDQVVLTINTPGLEYYASQPVIDMFMLSLIKDAGLGNTTFPLSIKNVTKMLGFFETYNVGIFVTLNTSNDWYPAFLVQYYWHYFIYRFLYNNINFDLRFSNSEFVMFTINSYDPYIGPVDIQIVGGTDKESLLAPNPNPVQINSNTSTIDALIDLTSVPSTKPVNISVETGYSTYSNSTPRTQTSFYSNTKPTVEDFTRVHLFSLSNETTMLMYIDISIIYENYEGIVEEVNYFLAPMLGSSVNITRQDNSWNYTGYYGFTYY
ncbi:MAG: phospholipid carrier-dependent glycosyltransferase [Candidatus Heimdallarchaeota archaeon]|nr:phospholipid carrier-dependent glycosyltransferase [Candidatus Heimdallarchaeota archaeon]MCK4769761.1 phospholipid carrier-dependent glycosyltransferase [Candidatus Heimdallarchaeota archaeon]